MKEFLSITALVLGMLGGMLATACNKEQAKQGDTAEQAKQDDTAGVPAPTEPPAMPDQGAAKRAAGEETEGLIAGAEVQPASGSNVSGTITFVEQNGTVEVKGELTGLTPGKHGFHIHEKGDCSAPDATSAGEHFNPTQRAHGAPDEGEHHAGDMGNVEAGQDGTAKFSFSLKDLTVAEGDSSVIGRAIVVHADPDDLKSQPSGNAGKRIGCGVIQLRK